MSSVKLSLVNDFYEREPACTRPKTKKDQEQKQIEQAEGKQNTNPKSSGRIELELDSSDVSSRAGHFAQIRTDSNKQTATVSLQDCLACSGCVTSAETVLIQQQSTAEFLSHLPTSTSTSTSSSNPSTVIVTISPQSLVSIAAAAGLTPIQTAKRLTTFFHSIGVKYVFDTAFTLDIALIEARAEFLSRLSSTSSPSPLLTSECPGWICFAEKKHGTMIIPYISTVRSPQQIMGAFVKGHFASLHSLPPSSIYHVTIMPCYDKKLEASRDDFYDAENNIRHVDCVLTTGEVQQLIQERCMDLQTVEETALHPDYFNVSPDQQTLYIAPDMGSSGGYAESMARTIATEMQITTPITWQTGMVGRRQQPDLRYTHITGIYNGIQRTIKIATYYGFRHIEKLMKDVKQGKHEYDYVEVMACPSGCLNGGGQIKYEGTTLTTSNIPLTTSTTTPPASSTVIPVKSAIEKQKELLTKLEQLYHTRQERPLSSNPVVTRLYRDWIGADPYSSTARQHLHTQYHALDAQEVNPLAIKW